MKSMITISLTKEEATQLMKVLHDVYCDNKGYGFDWRVLDDLTDLLGVKPFSPCR
jgi:uncharacterized protein (UPF0335 family)